MTTPFYINVAQDYGKILVTYIDANGEKRRERRDFYPTLYLTSRMNDVADTEMYHTIKGERVYPFSPGNMVETRKFIEDHEKLDGFTIHGMNRPVYEFIGEKFPGDMSEAWDLSKINVAYIDIEVKSDDGFPEPMEARHEVTAITIIDNTGTRVYGCKPYTKPIPNGKYYQYSSEHDLLMGFMTHWRANFPDVVTGWNVKTFDMTYLFKRYERLWGTDTASRLSPWSKYREITKKTSMFGRVETWYEFTGVAILDYRDMYRKYGPPGQKESYSLNYISYLELGEKKLSYEEHGSLHNLYTKDFEKFIDYNIRDTVLVQLLEKKRGLLKLAFILAYDSKTNYEDVFYQTRMWDSLIYNYLKDKNIVPPPSRGESKTSEYEGAYVKDPQLGRREWVVSFDYTSLYPSLMMQFNISPDTIVEPEQLPLGVKNFLQTNNITTQALVDQSIDTSVLKKYNVVLAANGQIFRTDIEGFLPKLLRKMFEDRQKYKKLYITAKKEVEKRKHDGQDTSEAEQRVAMYDLLQLCKKVCLNSCYGATGTPYFRYYDERQAVAVTLSGQLAIKYMENKLNTLLREASSKGNKDFVLAVDTDSVYLDLSDFVHKLISRGPKSRAEIVGFLDRTCEEIIAPRIKAYNKQLAEYVNATTCDLDMKRESICDKTIWTAKKRYILSVIDQEGVRYDTPQIKMSGIEAVKSSTPEVCRNKIKECINLIMSSTEVEVQEFVKNFREDFKKLTPEDIAFPRSVNDLEKYYSQTTIYTKGTPIHVKGALFYNFLLHKYGLEKKYPMIREGDKIKYINLREPNPVGASVISFPGVLPKEFVDILPYIDYNTQFDKSFVDPVNIILGVIGWTAEPKSSLMGFFS